MRIQIELPKKRVQELESLMKITGIRTKKELLNTALTFFAWAVREIKNGRIITSTDETTGHYKQLVLPAFANIDVPSRRQASPPTHTEEANWFVQQGAAIQQDIQQDKYASELEKERQKQRILVQLLEKYSSLDPGRLQALKQGLLDTAGLIDTQNGFATNPGD